MIKNKVTKNDCRILLVPKYLTVEQFDNVGNFHKLKKILFSHEHDPGFQDHIQTNCPHLVNNDEYLKNLKKMPVKTETTKQFDELFSNKTQLRNNHSKQILHKIEEKIANNAIPNGKKIETPLKRSSSSNDSTSSSMIKTEDTDDSTDISNLAIDEISSLESSDHNEDFSNIRKRSRKNSVKYQKGKEKQELKYREKMINAKPKKTMTNKGGYQYNNLRKQKNRQKRINKLDRLNKNKIGTLSIKNINPFQEIYSSESDMGVPFDEELDDFEIKSEDIQENGSFTESLQTMSDSEGEGIELVEECPSDIQILEQIAKLVEQNQNNNQQITFMINQLNKQKQPQQKENDYMYPYIQRHQQNQQKKIQRKYKIQNNQFTNFHRSGKKNSLEFANNRRNNNNHLKSSMKKEPLSKENTRISELNNLFVIRDKIFEKNIIKQVIQETTQPTVDYIMKVKAKNHKGIIKQPNIPLAKQMKEQIYSLVRGYRKRVIVDPIVVKEENNDFGIPNSPQRQKAIYLLHKKDVKGYIQFMNPILKWIVIEQSLEKLWLDKPQLRRNCTYGNENEAHLYQQPTNDDYQSNYNN
ncbi:hypothetical protein M0813_10871 [Anaeramoeba flamelloides]|uniref:Uncharacterized protein n=1 Tax=Anaeramoeba flamelloides TaxID=1746091 RepID=A0ABQ8X359_9EUKA|nr:hypothetical protein M0813_10871 [Anaeramoeba flamelloides]